MKIFLLFLLLFIVFFINTSIYSQTVKVDSLYKIPFDTNKIKESALLSNTSEVFRYDSLYIWSDKRTLSEIMNERSGYFVNNFGLGGRNLINYNGYTSKDIGIFRDGIQINDILFGGFDVQNISVNEIEKIEEISNVSSFMYGRNSTGKSINVITKDVFRTKPFSQLRYSQDRFNSLNADVNFNLPFSRKLNWMIGATKHSIDGRYKNSEFDVWNARTRLSYFTSPKFNLKLNFYYDKIKRGLNEGLVYNPNESELEINTADVVNLSSEEQIENFYYDATLTGMFFKNKESLTKLMLYSSNSTREYRNQDSVTYDSVKYFKPPANYHYIQYVADLKQNLNYNLSKYSKLNLLIGGKIYFFFYDYEYSYFHNLPEKEYSFIFKGDYDFKNLYLSGFAKYEYKYEDVANSNSYFNIGAEGNYKLYFTKESSLKFFGGISNTVPQLDKTHINYSYNDIRLYDDTSRTYYEAGFEINILNRLKVNSYYFKNNYSDSESIYNSPEGINTTLSFKSKYFDALINYNYINSGFFPKNFIKSDLAFHDFLFKNKLNLRTGFNIKYYSSPDNYYAYSQSEYSFYGYVPNNIVLNGFQVDFYVGARIGSANVNLTIANIFNTFYYDTYLYPADNRGGLLNSISRFTIVWDFLN